MQADQDEIAANGSWIRIETVNRSPGELYLTFGKCIYSSELRIRKVLHTACVRFPISAQKLAHLNAMYTVEAEGDMTAIDDSA